MSSFLRYVHLLALGAWLGSLLFFSFLVAPGLFGALPRDMFGRAVSALFPRYYLFGAACGIVAIVSGLLLAALRAARAPAVAIELVLVALMTGLILYADRALLPRASEARAALAAAEGTPARDAAQARFDALHRRSVLLNGTVLVLGLAAFALASAPGPPR